MAVNIDPYVYGANQINNMYQNQQYNNAWSASQAQAQNEFQVAQNAKAMAFNQMEAAKNRNWQEYMSNTAHQREVRDLRAAGLNPVLSAMNGNGAAVTSGATAQGVTSAGAKGDTDESINGAIANVLGSVLNADYTLRAQENSAKSAENVAKIYTAMSEVVAEIGAAASRYGADKSYEASKYGSNMSYAASKYATDNSKFGLISNVGKSFFSALSDSFIDDPSINTGSGLLDFLARGVETGLQDIDDAVRDNDGYALITKVFPFLKKFDMFKVYK